MQAAQPTRTRHQLLQVQRPSMLDDDQLIERIRSGDETAFRQLIDKYIDRVQTLVASMLRNRFEVDDVVQDVFFKVYRKLDRFQGRSAFFTWLYRVAFNTATDHLKRKKRIAEASLDDMAGLDAVAGGASALKQLRNKELRVQMADAIASLPEKYRNILVLREYEGCTYDEIAKILQCSKGTVESRLFRARARLRARLVQYLSQDDTDRDSFTS